MRSIDGWVTRVVHHLGVGLSKVFNGVGINSRCVSDLSLSEQLFLSRHNVRIRSGRFSTIGQNKIKLFTVRVRHFNTVTATNFDPSELSITPFVSVDE